MRRIALAAAAVLVIASGITGVTVVSALPTGIPGAGRAGPAVAGAQALTWSVVPSPSRGPSYNDLGGVSCVSAADCTAAGYSSDGVVAKTLIEAWNGTSWSVVPSPNRGTSISALNGVACVSAADCTAAGYYSNSTPSGSGPSKALIESWNGTSWSVVPSPSEAGDLLQDVSCVSAASCTAVGVKASGVAEKTLIESWNGTSWSVVPSPNRGTGNNVLSAVACVSAADCTAVGSYRSSGASPSKTLIESWHGTGWSVVPSPSRGTHDNALGGVACVSAANCTAVGFRGGRHQRTLVESWHGTGWSVVPSPNRGFTFSGLGGVSCVSAADCTAVGLFGNGITKTLIESWNGTSWSVVPSPNRGADISDFGSVSCASAAGCMAVGAYISSGPNTKTLIQSGTAGG
jgi:hypothetical protein